MLVWVLPPLKKIVAPQGIRLEVEIEPQVEEKKPVSPVFLVPGGFIQGVPGEVPELVLRPEMGST